LYINDFSGSVINFKNDSKNIQVFCGQAVFERKRYKEEGRGRGSGYIILALKWQYANTLYVYEAPL